MWSLAIQAPVVAVVQADSIWLTSTVVSLIAVGALAVIASLYLYAGRRFHWLSNAQQIKLARTFRVAFGALFLAATILPYLVVKAPLLAVACMTLFLIGLIPVLVTAPDDETTYGDVPPAEGVEFDA